MNKVYFNNSWYKDREPFILSLDARVNKEKIEGLQRVDIALLRVLQRTSRKLESFLDIVFLF